MSALSDCDSPVAVGAGYSLRDPSQTVVMSTFVGFPRAKMRQFSPRFATMLTDVTAPVPSARLTFPVLTRTTFGPVPFRYRITRNRWTPVAVGPSSAVPSKITCARDRCWAPVVGMQEAIAADPEPIAVTNTAAESMSVLVMTGIRRGDAAPSHACVRMFHPARLLFVIDRDLEGETLR